MLDRLPIPLPKCSQGYVCLLARGRVLRGSPQIETEKRWLPITQRLNRKPPPSRDSRSASSGRAIPSSQFQAPPGMPRSYFWFSNFGRIRQFERAISEAFVCKKGLRIRGIGIQSRTGARWAQNHEYDGWRQTGRNITTECHFPDRARGPPSLHSLIS